MKRVVGEAKFHLASLLNDAPTSDTLNGSSASTHCIYEDWDISLVTRGDSRSALLKLERRRHCVPRDGSVFQFGRHGDSRADVHFGAYENSLHTRSEPHCVATRCNERCAVPTHWPRRPSAHPFVDCTVVPDRDMSAGGTLEDEKRSPLSGERRWP